jgi:hypothetical protein
MNLGILWMENDLTAFCWCFESFSMVFSGGKSSKTKFIL